MFCMFYCLVLSLDQCSVSEFISALIKMEKRHHFEMFEVSKLGRDKNVLVCKNLSRKVYAITE